MGKQYEGTWRDINNITWLAEIHDGNVSATRILKIGIDPKISYQGEGSNLFPSQIMSSRAEVIFTMRNSSDYGNFKNMASTAEQNWVLKIYRGGVLYWVGMILADQFEFLREAQNVSYAQVKVTAVDGLERLKGFTVQPLWFTSGRATFAYVAVQIINMVGLSDEFGAGTDYLRWAGQQDNANTHASYGTFDAKIRDLSFVKNKDIFKDAGDIEWMDCKSALEQILSAFGARIKHSDGVYWITQANAYNDTDWTYDTYNIGGANTAYNTTYTHRHTIVDDAVRPIFEAYPTQNFHPPVRAILAEFDRINGQISAKTIQNTTAITCTHNDIVAVASPPGRAVKIDIDIDFSYYSSFINKYEVHKTYYADNGAGGTKYQPKNGVWTAIAGSPIADVQSYTDQNFMPMTRHFKHSVELVAPPTGQTNLVCEVKVKKLKYALVGVKSGVPLDIVWQVVSTVDFEFTGWVTITQAYNTTTPWEYIQKNQFDSDLDTPRETNSEELQLKCGYYNGKKYDVGSVLVKTGAATWAEAGNWTAPWTALSSDLPAMLANQFAGIYSDYLPQTRAVLYDDSNYSPVDSLFFDSTIWVFNGGTHNLLNATMEGEWIGITIVYTNVNNNGEGERIFTLDEIIEDREKQFEVDLDSVRRMAEAIPLQVLPIEILGNATGAPTSDPGVDKEYVVGLYYDYHVTNPTLTWKVREYAAPGGTTPPVVITITVADSPYTITQTTGIVLIRCNAAGGVITVNLPRAGCNTAIYDSIKIDSSVNTITVDGSGIETIDGSTTISISTQYENKQLLSNNVNYDVI